MNVSFEMVDCDERLAESEGKGFGIGDSNEQCSGKTGAFGYGDGVEILERDAGLGDGGADNGNDVAQVLAGG